MRLRTYCGHLSAVLCIMLVQTGCVVRRGLDFGHWAQSGESIPLVRFVENTEAPAPAAMHTLALLPVIGKLPPSYLELLDGHVLREAKIYCRTPILTIDRHGKLAEYCTMENMLPMGGLWNTREAARLGQMVGVSHVLGVRVREWRQHQPQQLALDFILVETTYGASVLEMMASFDAREQQVQLALDRYLRQRSSRKYDRQNFDIVLRSPAEYSGFVFSQCMSVLADKIWNPQKLLKPGQAPTDNIVSKP